MNLRWGDWIIKSLSELPKNKPYALVIRHSERQDFDNLPFDQWNEALLTKEGIEGAFNFGYSLCSALKSGNVIAEGWGLERCLMTARRISEGATTAGCKRSRFNVLEDIDSPISDPQRYREYLSTGLWTQMLEDWLSDPSDGSVLKPFRSYASYVLGKVDSNHLPKRKGISVIVTHDLYIYPLLSALFEDRFPQVGFLDGLIITRNKTSLDVFNGDRRVSVARDFFEVEN